MSRKSDAKKSRRAKRRATRDSQWLPGSVHQELNDKLDEIVSGLEDFDAQLTERGWIFSEEPDDDVGVIWYWPPSHADVDDPEELTTATIVALVEAEGGEIAHVVFVGTDADFQFDLDELFDHIDIIEGYRLGDPLPEFDTD